MLTSAAECCHQRKECIEFSAPQIKEGDTNSIHPSQSPGT